MGNEEAIGSWVMRPNAAGMVGIARMVVATTKQGDKSRKTDFELKLKSY